MSTNADLAAKLLRDASGFFRNVGEQNPPIADQMTDNAQIYDQVATLVESDPTGELPQEAQVQDPQG